MVQLCDDCASRPPAADGRAILSPEASPTEAIGRLGRRRRARGAGRRFRLSYADQFNVTVVADRQLCPDLDTFVDGMKHSLEALRESVRAHG